MSAQATLTEYAEHLAAGARAAGEEGARRGDPDSFDLAVEAIRQTARLMPDGFDADHVRARLASPGSEIGTAFRHLSKLHEIEVIGYAASRHPAAHQRLLRRWRATDVGGCTRKVVDTEPPQ